MSESAPQAYKIEPYPGQSRREIKGWIAVKYPNGITGTTCGAYAAELYKSKRDYDDWNQRLTDFQRKVLAKTKRRNTAKKDEKDRIAFRDRFNLSDDESREYWKLRGLPAKPGEKQSEWQRIYDRLRKALKATPRTNADLSKKTPDEKKAHRTKQNREAKARSRANAKAAAAINTPALSAEEEEAQAVTALDAVIRQIEADRASKNAAPAHDELTDDEMEMIAELDAPMRADPSGGSV